MATFKSDTDHDAMIYFINNSSSTVQYTLSNQIPVANSTGSFASGSVGPYGGRVNININNQGYLYDIPETNVLMFDHVDTSGHHAHSYLYAKFTHDPNDSSSQHIDFITIDGFTAHNGSDLSSARGNGFHITVDGHGVDDPSMRDIYFQIYDDPMSKTYNKYIHNVHHAYDF